MTQQLLDTLIDRGDLGLDQGGLEDWARRLVALPDGSTVGVELVALARRLVEIGSTALAEQLVVLAGLALGDSSGAQLKAPPAAVAPRDPGHFRPTPVPAGAVSGGPLARWAAEARLETEVAPVSACPFHRAVAKVSGLARRRRNPL